MSDDLASILATEEARLIRARDEAFEVVQRRPIGANRKAYRKACVALEDFLRAKTEPEGERTFASILEVVDFLDSDGWKISRSTAYDHWKKDGKISARPDGTFALSAVQEYARVHLQKKDGTPGPLAGPNLQEEKLQEEIRRIRHDADMRELNLRTKLGELIPKDHVEAELAERAQNLKMYLDAFIRSAAGQIIKLVGGDPLRAPQLITYMLGANRKAMDNYSRPIQGLEEEKEEE